MMMTHLPHRGVLEIQGEDKASFLQGLITNDINDVTVEHAIYATLLSPQGRFLYDFFIMEKAGSHFLDAEASRLADLVKRFSLYKLRSRVTLTARPDVKVFALWGENVAPILGLKNEPGHAHAGIFMDPRLVELGARLISDVTPDNGQPTSLEDYNLHRLKLGIPEGGIDLIPDKSIPLECGLDELNAINWKKGCYIGQELTTRTKFLGLVRKRLFPVKIEGPAPDFGAEVFLEENSIGVMRSHADGYGLALLRLEHLKFDEGGQGQPLRCGEASLLPYKPFWMKF
jgi:folate-binding protein YgfZ